MCHFKESTGREVDHHVHTMFEVKTSEGSRQTTVFSAPLHSCCLSSSHLKWSHALWIMFFFSVVHQWSANALFNGLARLPVSHMLDMYLTCLPASMLATFPKGLLKNLRVFGNILSDTSYTLDSFLTKGAKWVLLVWMATLDVRSGWVGVSNQTAKPVRSWELECLMLYGALDKNTGFTETARLNAVLHARLV